MISIFLKPKFNATADQHLLQVQIVHAKRGNVLLDKASILPPSCSGLCYRRRLNPFRSQDRCFQRVNAIEHLRHLQYFDVGMQSPSHTPGATVFIQLASSDLLPWQRCARTWCFVSKSFRKQLECIIMLVKVRPVLIHCLLTNAHYN